MGRLFEPENGRLSGRLAAKLDPRVQDALDHPVRREVLRTLNRSGRPRGVAEIKTELRAFRLSELSYHLHVLRRSGAVASHAASGRADRGHARYASEVEDDGRVKAVLRATEQWDRERREAVAEANASPLLTMFRIPRPVRSIRLRGLRRVDAEQNR